jgi:hypothetical protein
MTTQRSSLGMDAFRCCVTLCCLLLLAACGRSFKVAAARAGVPLQAAAVAELAAARSQSLAYEHTVAVELGRDLLSPRMKEVQATCATRTEFACELLDASFDAQLSVPSGSLRMRLAPAAVEPLVAMAANNGRITSRSTHAEDLAQPVADTDRELSLLSSHRDRLTEFMKSKELKVDQLIAVSKELASVQTQIDALSTQRANLRRRIDTELLTISFSPPREAYSQEQTPIVDALHSFGGDFKSAVAQVIRFIAVLLPWLVIIVPSLFLFRAFWRLISRWLAQRHPRPQSSDNN